MEEKYIRLLDENENETLAEVLFTFEKDGDNYVILQKTTEFDSEEEQPVFAYLYEELEDKTIGNLIEIQLTDTKRWELIEEMFNTFCEDEFEG